MNRRILVRIWPALMILKEASEDIQTTFLLSDDVYAKARVPPTENVCLWLGANVMLEYSLEDAVELLTNNLTSSHAILKEVSVLYWQ